MALFYPHYNYSSALNATPTLNAACVGSIGEVQFIHRSLRRDVLLQKLPKRDVFWMLLRVCVHVYSINVYIYMCVCMYIYICIISNIYNV